MLMRVKTNYYLLIAPVITLFMTGAFFAVNNIFPFGENTVSWCDMNQQTIPLLMDFKDILDGKASIFYSTANAGGMNFWGVFLFFLASPFYLMVKFVEKSHLIYLVNILLAVKLSLSAFTASVYFKKVHRNLKKEFCVLLSIMYALCGYGIMYYQTLVWLDIMILFPLLALSVIRMCRQNKPLMYGVVLSLMMITCFYLSYMIIIYLMLAVPLYIAVCCRGTEKRKAAMSFVGTSFICALLTAPIWLCSYIQTSHSARGGSVLAELMYKPLFENTANKLCVIMCTALCVAILPFFIKNKIVKNKNIKYNLILLAGLIIPVFIDPINKMWQTGSYQSFPLRYGFIIVFVLLVLCAYYFENIQDYGKNSKGFVLSVAIMAAGYIAIAVYVVYKKKSILSSYTDTLNVNSKAFELLLGLFALACITYIMCIYLREKKLITARTLSIILFLVFCGEVYTSMSVNIGYVVSDGGVLKTSAELEYDSCYEPYYRTKTEKKYLHVNMVGGLGYNSLSHYTSLTNEDYMFAMKKLGYSSYWMEVGSNGGTVITDALLSVRYSIGAYYDFKSYYDIANLDGDFERGESDICCPVGITSKLSPENFVSLGDGARVDIQRQLAEKIFGSDEMIYEYEPSFTADGSFEYKNSRYKIDVSDDENSVCQMRYSIDVSGKQTLYFDVFDRLSNDLYEKYYGAADIYVNGTCIAENYPTQKNNGIVTLGEFEDTTVEILVIVNKDISVKSLGVFGVDTDILQSYTKMVQGCDLYVDGNELLAECTSADECWLYTSVPFDRGLSAYVNGTETDIIKVNESFCAIKLQEGRNKIRFCFIPQGMTAAVILLIAGILICIMRAVGIKKSWNLKALENAAYIMTIILFMAVIVFIYIFPFILRISVIASNLF